MGLVFWYQRGRSFWVELINEPSVLVPERQGFVGLAYYGAKCLGSIGTGISGCSLLMGLMFCYQRINWWCLSVDTDYLYQ